MTRLGACKSQGLELRPVVKGGTLEGQHPSQKSDYKINLTHIRRL